MRVREMKRRFGAMGCLIGLAIWLACVIGFWPGIAILTRPFGPEELCVAAHRCSPGFLFDEEEIDRVRERFSERQELLAGGRAFKVASMTLRLPTGIDEKPWVVLIASSTDFLRTNLASYAWVEAIEIRPMSGAEGRYDGLTLAIDPTGPEPFRTMTHELSHCWLLWALLPSLPVDCPRWFNEGLVEEVAARLTGETPLDDAAQLVSVAMVVAPHELSPAFAGSGRRGELQARRLFQRFLRDFGWEGVRRIVEGLRRSRPFCSAFPLAFGRRFEPWMEEAHLEFQRRDVLEHLPRRLARIRLRRLLAVRPTAEVKPLLKAGIARWPEDRLFKRLYDEAVSAEIRQALIEERLAEARGRLRELKLPESRERATMLLASGVVEAGRNAMGSSTIAPARSGALPVPPSPAGQPSETRGRGAPTDGERTVFPSGGASAWLGALIGGTALWLVFLFLRESLVPVIVRAWRSGTPSAHLFRWLSMGALAIFGCWFIRFLVVAMIPYGGVASWPDALRALFAEVLSVVFLVLLWRQLAASIPSACVGASTPNRSSDLFAHPVVGGLAVLAIWGIAFDGLFAAETVPLAIPAADRWLAVGAHLAKIAATGVLFWDLTRRWQQRVSGTGPWLPAVVFALLRGGMWISPVSLPWLLLQGRILAGMALSGHHLMGILAFDLLVSAPQAAVLASWVPAFDPLAAWGTSRISAWEPGAAVAAATAGVVLCGRIVAWRNSRRSFTGS